MSSLPKRSPRIADVSQIRPRWHSYTPEFSCAANSVSLMMPYVEPYVVRSTKAAFANIEEPLLSEAKAYVVQETQHQVVHRRFNKVLSDRYWGVPFLERMMKATFGALERIGGVESNLAFAAGSEAVAYNAARWVSQHHKDLFFGADTDAQELFVWHLAEEVEHKSVAVDVFNAFGGSRFRYALGMLTAFAMLGVFAALGTFVMAIQERAIWYPRTYFNLIRWTFGFVFEALPNMVMSVTSDHHPTDLVDPGWFEEWLDEMDREIPLAG